MSISAEGYLHTSLDLLLVSQLDTMYLLVSPRMRKKTTNAFSFSIIKTIICRYSLKNFKPETLISPNDLLTGLLLIVNCSSQVIGAYIIRIKV